MLVHVSSAEWAGRSRQGGFAWSYQQQLHCRSWVEAKCRHVSSSFVLINPL